MRPRSLTRRLIVGVLLAEGLCAALFSAVAIEHEMRGRNRAFDVVLRGRADSLLGAVQDTDDPEASVRVDPMELVLPREDVYEVLSPAGKVIGQSDDASPEVLRQLSSQMSAGYFNFKADVPFRGLRTEGVRVIDRVENGGVRRPVTLLYASPRGHLLGEVLEAARFYILTSLVLLALTALLLVWLLRRWLSPLNELALSASRVSVDAWEFHATEAALQIRELAPIASSIQQLLAGLETSFNQQRRFIGDAAHELKTSIAVFKSSVQLLLMRRRSAEEYEREAGRLLVDIGRMEAISQRMLTLASQEESAPDPEACADLDGVMRAVAAQMSPIAELRGISLRMHGAAVLAAIAAADAELLCSNLLLNALEHSAPGDTVELAVLGSGDGALLTITDHGEGIAAEVLPHVFERFYRVDSSRSRESGGAGLGLAICKAIVGRYGGEIALGSVPGEGTTAKVTLPAAAKKAGVARNSFPPGLKPPSR